MAPKRQRIHRMTRWASALAVVCMSALLMPAVAMAASPTAPVLTDVYVEDPGQVTISWTASTCADDHDITYTVYRLPQPVTPTNVIGAEKVGEGIPTTSLTVVASADEQDQAYVWYYAVRAYDGTYSSRLSKTMAPNLHGYRMSTTAVACTRCHEVHGAYPEDYDYTYVDLCYECHASSAQTSPETDIGDKSSYNIKAEFKEYPSQEPTGSAHRSTKMETDRTECDACHSPHRSPYYYDNNGDYVAGNSYRKMLRVQTGTDADGPTYTYYSYNDDTLNPGGGSENVAFCMACHGASPADTNMGYVSDTGYADTVGDHNSANYATTAHGISGTTAVRSNDYGKTNQSEYPQVQCLACHNKHASAADKLIAYRGNDADGGYAQAKLCFACHSAAGAAAELAAGTAVGDTNLAWNKRDVQAEFGKTSHHPTTAQTGGPIAQPGTWTQASQADFQSDTLVNTVATASGSVELVPVYTSSTILNEGFESNSLTTNGWIETGGSWATSTGNTHSGTYKASVENASGTDYFYRRFDTSGLTDPQISFWWSFNGSGTDWFSVDVSTDGSTWSTLMPQNTADRLTYTPSTYSIPVSTTTWIRFGASLNNTGEYARVDDVVISGLAPGGTYVASGSAVSTAISAAGSLEEWGTLSYNKTQPSGTALSVDVLDASDDSVLLADAASGTDLSSLTASSLKLRSNLTGNAGTPRSVTDDFNDNSFDTAKWNDVFLNSTDPDSGGDMPWSSATEPFTNLSGWTLAPSLDCEWVLQTTDGNPPNCAELTCVGTTNRRPAYMTRQYDTSGKSNLYATFEWKQGSTSGNDFLELEVSTNGTDWTQIWNEGDSTTTSWTSVSTASGTVPASSTLYVRFRSAVRSSGRYYRVDNFQIRGTQSSPPTDIWPQEASQQLTLRAEGAGFTGTADQGEFTYIDPAQSGVAWIATTDFDLRVHLGAVRSNSPQAGLMIRTGGSEANAIATNAAFVGVWPTGGTSADFRYRTTAGGTTQTNGSSATTLPEWLRITRDGDTFAAYISDNGSSWTRVGTDQTVSMDTTVLVGLGTTSGTNDSFSEADYDNFSITEAGLASTATPALNDWTVTYTYFPAAGNSSLTCANCHNVHSVVQDAGDEATLTNWWLMGRVSDPDNTKNNYSGTHRDGDATSFCLKCHDGGAPTTAGNNATTLVPYAVEFSAQTAPFFPGWNKRASGADWANSAHDASGVQNMTPECSSCHDPHGSDNPRLTALTAYIFGATNTNHVNQVRNNTTAYAEENLCYACHTNDTTPNCAGGSCHGTGARTVALINVQTAFGLTYRHPVGDFSGRHSDTELGTDLGPADTDRHAECADCHDPHAARNGLHTQADSTAGNAIRGVVGLKPNYPAHDPSESNHTGNWTALASTDYTSERMSGEDTDFEAYVCLKCHSSYSGQPYSVTSNGRTYTSTDLAMEFNPSNFSEHNVFGQSVGMETAFTVNSTNVTWNKPTDASFLLTGWNSDSQMTCTDCHSNNTTAAAKGPHGSSTPYMLVAPWSATTGWSNFSSSLCGKCHTNITNMNSVHREHSGRADYCQECHTAIPHGWKRPRLLGYTTDPEPYATLAGGLKGIRVGTHGPSTGWSQGNDCLDDGCYGREHASATPLWP